MNDRPTIIVSTCVICNHVWSHQSTDISDIGYYLVTCTGCNETLLRCSTCNKVLPARRRPRMVDHQSTHQHNTQSSANVYDTNFESGDGDFFVHDGADVDIFSADGEAVDVDKISTTDIRAQFMRESIAANSAIIAQRGDALLSLFQDNQYNHDEGNNNCTEGDVETMDSLINALESEAEPLIFENTQSTESDNTKMSISDFVYMNGDNNKAYFMQEQNMKNGGVCGLAARALNKVTDLGMLAELEEADYMFATLNLLVNSSPADQDKILSLNKKTLSVIYPTTSLASILF